MQAETEFEAQTLPQARIDGLELRQGPTTLLRMQAAQIGHGQLQASTVQIQIHGDSSTAGSQRWAGWSARGGGQISS